MQCYRVGFLFLSVVVAGCGGDNGGGSGGIGGYGPCEVRAANGPVTEVDLLINSPLPVELSGQCAQGDPSTLQAFLSLGAQSCVVSVDASGAQGCCPAIAADQNFDAVITYRVAASFTTLVDQSLFVQLPSTSEPVVTLSFAGRPVTLSSAVDNLTPWCAGTL